MVYKAILVNSDKIKHMTLLCCRTSKESTEIIQFLCEKCFHSKKKKIADAYVKQTLLRIFIVLKTFYKF